MNMISKVLEKAYALGLRKKGFSYNEILKRVPVSKSSLSLWLRDSALSEDERRLLKERVTGNITRGRLKAAAAHRASRELRDKELFARTRELYDQFKQERLFQVGIALYWAEGAKRSTSFLFMSSDKDMINMMLDWIERYFEIKRSSVGVRLFIHKPYANENGEAWWSKELGIPAHSFKKTVFKPSGKLVRKRPDYKGCVRIELHKGLPLRRMKFLMSLFLDDYLKNSMLLVSRP